MEDKRTVWIVAAVGIFLAVVLVSARLMGRGQSSNKNVVAKYPVNSEDKVNNDSAKDNNTPSASGGWTKTASDADSTLDGITDDIGNPATRVNDMTVVAQNATVFALQREQSPSGNGAQSTAAPKVSVAPIDLNQIGSKNIAKGGESSSESKKISADDDYDSIRAGGSSGADKAVAVSKAVVSQKVQSAPVAATKTASAKTAAPVVKKVVVEKTAPVKTAAAPAKSTPKAPKADDTTWWVQAASFSSLKYADNARETLGHNKINADVFTYKDVAGKVFYRVRVGPYLTKSEAEYWKDRIGQIESFAATQSFVVRG